LSKGHTNPTLERSGKCAWDRRPAMDVNTLAPVTSDALCDVRGAPRDEQSKPAAFSSNRLNGV